jgi:hypothetical protein
MVKNWFQRKENQPALITSTGAIIAAIIAGLFLWGNGCFSKTPPPAPANTNAIKADGQATVNVSNRNDDHSQHINNFYISGTGYVVVSLGIVAVLFFVVRSRSQSKTEKSEPPKETPAPRELAPSEIRTQSLMDCFSKLVGVTTAFKNYVCYMPDEEERAKNRDNYAKKIQGFENDLKTNLFVPAPIKSQIKSLLDEIERQVSHYITSIETTARPISNKNYRESLEISDFAKEACPLRLKAIEKEFHILLHPSGNIPSIDTVNTVKALYPKLIALRAAYDNYRQMMEPPSRDKNFKELKKCFDDAYNSFSDNRLYLNETTTENVNKVLTFVNASTTQFRMALTEAESDYRNENERGTLFTTHFQTDNSIPTLYAIMERDFKRVLGIT